MSAAMRATTAKARASIAARKLIRQKMLGRSFDDCFEMGDGDDVYRILVRRADVDPELRDAVLRHGYAYWLEECYRRRYGA